MARRRFFVPPPHHGVAELVGADAEHLVRVLRVEPGDVFEISDNTKAYLAEVETARKSSVVFRVQEQLPPEEPKVFITLCAALIKFERFDWLIEKSTELGVSRILPFAAVRSEHGLLQASQKRVERWRRVALEASQQSRRTHLPIIDAGVRASVAAAVHADIRLLLDEESAAPILSELPQRPAISDRIALALGPEGGWTQEEREDLKKFGWRACSLGRNILRAETAAVAGLAVIQAAWSLSSASQSPHEPASLPPAAD